MIRQVVLVHILEKHHITMDGIGSLFGYLRYLENIDLIGWDSWFVDELFINQVEVSKNIAKLELEAQIISDTKQGGLITISEQESSLRKEKIRAFYRD